MFVWVVKNYILNIVIKYNCDLIYTPNQSSGDILVNKQPCDVKPLIL